MEMRGLFKGRGANGAASVDAPADVRAELVFSDAQRLEMLNLLEASGSAWFWATDAQHNVSYLSPGCAQAFDASEKLLKRPITELFESASQDLDEANDRPIAFILRAKSKMTDQPVRLLNNQAEESWWSLTGRPHFDKQNNFLGYRGSAKDITHNFKERRESLRTSQFDALTGLANRARMAKHLENTVQLCEQNNRSFGLLMLDLDRFKQINDSLGHSAGDDLLRQVSQRLQRIVPQSAELARLGADEFQILVPDCDDRGVLAELANRAIQMIAQPYTINENRALIGTSIGISVYPYDGDEPEDLAKAADLALAASKGAGRGQYRFYSKGLRESAFNHHEIEKDLHDAIVSNQLEMHYQPMVCTKTGAVKTFEAVVRWNHPERGPISPATFVPIAEETDLILKLGEWTMRQACRDAAQWPGSIRVSINVSAQQFRQEDLPDLVSNALVSANLPPDRVELEITETVFVGDKSAADDMFKRLKQLGVGLALDDFGTGYSSLGFLRGAPFDKVKIDKSFVDDCTSRNDSSLAIVTAIVALAKALNMKTTAEGVEALDQLACIKELGADLVQGFVYSKPVPQAKVLEKLADGDFSYEATGPKHHRSDRRSMYRRIGAIHDDHRYEVVLRNLSATGAMIEGILDVPKGTDLVLDLGEGQLVVGNVRRSWEARQGLLFEIPLISDGADGLCTRHRVPPSVLEATEKRLRLEKGASRPAFMQVAVQTATSSKS